MDQRKEFALRALHTSNFRALCREFHITPATGYKWRARLLEEGLHGLAERSRRPQHHPETLSEEVLCRIIQLKHRHPTWGAHKLRRVYARQHQTAPSESSFKRILARCGLVAKRPVRRAPSGGQLRTGRRATACNDVWTVDFKGWWYDREGRCEPLTVRDEYSRYLLELRALPNAQAATVRACFSDLFARYGKPAAIRSDNGAPFASPNGLLGLSSLSAWWLAQGIELERSRPGCPQDNGGHERLHRDIAAELEGVEHVERQAAFDVWRQEFNEERPHQALGMKVPQEVYTRSGRRWDGGVTQLHYPQMATRRVHKSGKITYGNERIYLSQALVGWDVGLRPLEGGQQEVYFAQLLLGHLEPLTASFHAATTAA